MGFWGTYLLFCFFSFLSQVTAESPTPKTKKAANAKKGKQEAATHSSALGAAFPLSSGDQSPFPTLWGQLPS